MLKIDIGNRPWLLITSGNRTAGKLQRICSWRENRCLNAKFSNKIQILKERTLDYRPEINKGCLKTDIIVTLVDLFVAT